MQSSADSKGNCVQPDIAIFLFSYTTQPSTASMQIIAYSLNVPWQSWCWLKPNLKKKDWKYVFMSQQRSIERAMPIIHRDVDSTLTSVGIKADAILNDANKKVGPILTTAAEKAEILWAEIKRRNDLVSDSPF